MAEAKEVKEVKEVKEDDPCPCTGCGHRAECRGEVTLFGPLRQKHAKACSVYEVWTDTGRASDVSRDPTEEVYDRIYPDG